MSFQITHISLMTNENVAFLNEPALILNFIPVLRFRPTLSRHSCSCTPS